MRSLLKYFHIVVFFTFDYLLTMSFHWIKWGANFIVYYVRTNPKCYVSQLPEVLVHFPLGGVHCIDRIIFRELFYPLWIQRRFLIVHIDHDIRLHVAFFNMEAPSNVNVLWNNRRCSYVINFFLSKVPNVYRFTHICHWKRYGWIRILIYNDCGSSIKKFLNFRSVE